MFPKTFGALVHILAGRLALVFFVLVTAAGVFYVTKEEPVGAYAMVWPPELSHELRALPLVDAKECQLADGRIYTIRYFAAESPQVRREIEVHGVDPFRPFRFVTKVGKPTDSGGDAPTVTTRLYLRVSGTWKNFVFVYGEVPNTDNITASQKASLDAYEEQRVMPRMLAGCRWSAVRMTQYKRPEEIGAFSFWRIIY